MADLIDLSAYREKPTALESSGGGGDSTGMEPRIAKLEAHMEHVLADTSQLKADVGKMRVDVATLVERIAALPSKGFIVGVVVAGLGAFGALSVFAANVRALFGLH
jgi:hypothetical protein